MHLDVLIRDISKVCHCCCYGYVELDLCVLLAPQNSERRFIDTKPACIMLARCNSDDGYYKETCVCVCLDHDCTIMRLFFGSIWRSFK